MRFLVVVLIGTILGQFDPVFAMGSKKPTIPGTPTKPETEIATIPPGEGFRVDFVPVKSLATVEEMALIEKASVKLNETIKGQCFKDFILKAKLNETQGRTNLEVLNHILGMREVVPVKMYFRKWGCKIGCTTAIAYRKPPEKSINLNRSYFTTKRSACVWAATMAHESLGHSLGNYSHSMKWNVAREYTVPYKIGGAKKEYGSNAFESCCQD